MGYKTQWKFACHGEESSVLRFEKCLQEMLEAENDCDKRSTLELILTSTPENQDEGLNWFVRSGLRVKKCIYWNSVIDILTKKAMDFGLSTAYMKIGEDPDDFEVFENGDIWIELDRSIGSHRR